MSVSLLKFSWFLLEFLKNLFKSKQKHCVRKYSISVNKLQTNEMYGIGMYIHRSRKLVNYEVKYSEIIIHIHIPQSDCRRKQVMHMHGNELL